MSIKPTVESLLLESDDEADLGDIDLSKITVEDILREEEMADGTSTASNSTTPTAGSRSNASSTLLKSNGVHLDDEKLFSPANITLSITPLPGMEVVPSSSSSSSTTTKSPSMAIQRRKSGTNTTNNNENETTTTQQQQQQPWRSVLEIAEAREKQLLSCIGVELLSPLQVKRRLRAQARTKNLASKRSSKQKSKQKTDTDSTAAAGIVKVKTTGVVKVEAMETISRQLKKNMEFKDYGPGSPTVVAIHSKFIAIGTSKGLVLIFDHFQNIRQVLGNTNDTDGGDGAITAIDVSPGSDFLVCGYQSGRIVLWDMIKGSSLKAVSDAHENPVVCLRFLKDQKPLLVSVDTNGIVNRINFSKRMGMVYVVDIDPIYDGSAGRIVSLSILPQSAGNAKISSLTDQYCLAAINSEKVTFIIAIEPEVKILHRWARPNDIQPDDPVLPSVSFAWISFPGSTRALAPVLSRGWGKHVQFLEVIFSGGPNHTHGRHGWPTFEEHEEIESCTNDVMAVQWLGDQVVVYLNSHDEICVYDVMSRQELEIVDVSSLELVFASYRGKNARSFSNSFRGCDNILYLLGLKELQTARVQPWTQRIDTLVEEGEWLEALALALDHYEGLKTAASERAERDRFPPVFFRNKQNDQCVVDLLHMSQTNQRTGEKEDIFRHEDGSEAEIRWTCGNDPYPSDIAKRLEETLQKGRNGQVLKNFVPISVNERVADLLMEYVRLAIANAPTTTTTSSGSSSSHSGSLYFSRTGSSNKLDLSKSHYQMLAGVCIEYCAIVDRTDLLFGEIFQRFKECHKADVFVELLEPYILSERLRTLSPEAMQEFVAQYQSQKKLSQVEQCLLHLNVKQLDIDTMVKLCKENELYSALIYIYNEGLNDYVTPIDILMEACSSTSNPSLSKLKRAESRGGNIPPPAPALSSRSTSGNKVSSLASSFGGTVRSARDIRSQVQEEPEKDEDPATVAARRRRLYGYKLLLYISYSLSGRNFPQGTSVAQRNQISRIRAQICQHLFQKQVENDSTPYPRLVALLDLDTKVFLDVFAKIFDDPTVEFDDVTTAGAPTLTAIPSSNPSKPLTRYDSARNANLIRCPNRISMALAIAEVLFSTSSSSKRFSSIEHGHFYMFEARLLSGGSIDAKEYAAAKAEAEKTGTTSSSLSSSSLRGSPSQESMMDSLLNFLALGPETSTIEAADGLDKEERQVILVKLLQKLSKESYNHTVLLQHVMKQQMNRAAVILYKEKNDFTRTIASYLADTQHEYRMGAFQFIRTETDKISDDSSSASNNAEDTSSATSNTIQLVKRREIEDAVLTHTPALMETDNYSFVVLIVGTFPNLNNKVIQKFLSIGGKSGTRLEFLFLKLLLHGSQRRHRSAGGQEGGQQEDDDAAGDDDDDEEENGEGDLLKELLDRSRLRLADDPAVQERFVRLLCEFEPSGVFRYLETHDSYKVDACLKLCKDYSITDAEAYLLERTGDVTGALTLILQSLEQKLKILKPALRGYNASTSAAAVTAAAVGSSGSTAGSSSSGTSKTSTSTSGWTASQGSSNDSIIESLKEGKDVLQTLEVALAMCQRNSQRNRDSQAEKLWFTLLDKLLRIQNAVKRSVSARNIRGGSTPSTRGASGSSSSGTAFQVALNEVIRIVLERMASCVSLKAILFKITNEHGKGEFGDFRPTIFGMLDTYNYEQNIYQTANGLISVDLFDQVTTLRRAKTRAFARPSNTCHYCKVILTKPPFGMGYSSSASGGERWNVNTSMVMVVGGHTFHESCGKIWQQEEDSGGAAKAARDASRRKMSRSSSERGSVGGSGDAEEDLITRQLNKRQPSTRRYLNRLKNSRRSSRRVIHPHVVLESLIREDNGRNKYLKSSRAVFSMKPDPDQVSKSKKRVGARRPGSLPLNAIQKGGI